MYTVCLPIAEKNLFKWCATVEKIWAYHSKGIGQTKVPAEAIFCKLSKNYSFYISKFFQNFINLLQLLLICTYVRCSTMEKIIFSFRKGIPKWAKLLLKKLFPSSFFTLFLWFFFKASKQIPLWRQKCFSKISNKYGAV